MQARAEVKAAQVGASKRVHTLGWSMMQVGYWTLCHGCQTECLQMAFQARWTQSKRTHMAAVFLQSEFPVGTR